MPKSKYLPVDQLKLDLRNYRALPQKDEQASVRTIISINAEKFWGVMESLLSDGYSPVDSILVLHDADGNMIVREGNRRIGALKLMLGHLDIDDLDVPSNIREAVGALDIAWKKEIETVPCAIYENKDADLVSRIVARVHGRMEKASRVPWTAIAKARHDRDEMKKSVPELDLLEKYLGRNTTLTGTQKERWSGNYPMTVLEAFLQKHTTRLGFKNAKELAAKYPKIPLRLPLENLLFAIGSGTYGFEDLRHPEGDVLFKDYKIPPLPAEPEPYATTGNKAGGTSTPPVTTGTGAKPPPKGTKALPLNDPVSIIKALKGFNIRGSAREKVATLAEEAILIKIEKTPLAFCFLLRSMFEISAIAYCADHKGATGPVVVDKEGKPKKLGQLLKAISKHFVDNSGDENDKKLVHGAGVVLNNPASMLSVTSLNNLVHSQTFSTKPSDLSVDFHKVFPLLKAMNA